MKKHIVAIITLAFCTTIFAQQADFEKANAFYKSGNYDTAIETYQSILTQYGSSPEIYYNLGNAYFKQDEIGKSILNYERALRLSPNYDDARNNLDFAQTKVVDNIVQVPPFFVKKWTVSLIRALSVDQWYVISVILFILSLTATLIFIFGNSLWLRKISFYGAFVIFALTVVTFIFASTRYKQTTEHNEAIIMSGAVTIKSSPDRSGTDLFQLHEGTKVKLHSSLDNWVEVELGNGDIGWIESKNIEKI